MLLKYLDRGVPNRNEASLSGFVFFMGKFLVCSVYHIGRIFYFKKPHIKDLHDLAPSHVLLKDRPQGLYAAVLYIFFLIFKMYC